MNATSPKSAWQKAIDALPDSADDVVSSIKPENNVSSEPAPTPQEVGPEPEVEESPALEANAGDISEFFDSARRAGAENMVIAALNDMKSRGRQMTAEIFRLDDARLTPRVVDLNSKKQNTYWCSGETVESYRPPDPPTIEQVARGRILHSDCDFHVGESFELGYPRVLTHVGKLVAEGKLPEPSMTVFSGGGFQFYWFGTEPIAPDEIKARNRHINQLTGGDHTHNCNRLLRIPGTVNWLNAAKRKRGRVPTLSRIVREVLS